MRLIPLAALAAVASQLVSPSADAVGAIAPLFDPASICANATPERTPDGAYFRVCYREEPVSGGQPKLRMVLEKFLPGGQLDLNWSSAGRTRADVEQSVAGNQGCDNLGSYSRKSLYFPPDGRILVFVDSDVRLRAFRADGKPDSSYGIEGTSASFCARTESTSERLVSLHMLDDGRFVSILNTYPRSQVSFVARYRFAARRLLANGLPDLSFGVHGDGAIQYPALENDLSQHPGRERAIAWSLQADESLEVSYAIALDSATPSLIVGRQGRTGLGIAYEAGRALPRRGVTFDVEYGAGNLYRQDGSVSRMINSSKQLILQGDGGVLLFPLQLAADTAQRNHLVIRFLPSGQLDPAFGYRGIYLLENPLIPKRETLAQFCNPSLDTRFYLQADNSLVYSGSFDIVGGGFPLYCFDPRPRVAFAAKLTPDGKLDPAFPQWKDPTVSGAVFSAESPAWTAAEYYNPNLDRYFMTPHPLEQYLTDIDPQLRAAGWRRTGKTFGVWNPDSTIFGTKSACRFAADPIVPPKSFYDSVIEHECDDLRAVEVRTPPGQRIWRYDRESFRATPATDGACPSGLVPTYALHNRGYERGIDTNFRYVNNLADFDAMIARGWAGVKTAQFCARPD